MTKKILLLVFLLGISGMIFSQQLSKDFTVSYSKPYKVIDAGSKRYISLDNGYVIMAKMGKGIVHLQKFDVNGMEEVARNEYNDLPPTAFFQDVIKLKDHVYYIYEAYNKKQKNFTVYSREILTDNATFGKQIPLFTTTRKAVANRLTNLRESTASFFKFVGNKFTVYKSFDNSKVMIQYRLYPLIKDDKKNYDEIGFFVFDNTMNKIWGKEVKMPYTEAQINNVAYAVSNSGKALMLVTNNEKKEYETIIVDESGTPKTSLLGMSTNKLVRKMLVKEDEAGNFICAGYYANGIEFKFDVFSGGTFVFNVNGLLYAKIDGEGKLIESKTFDFPKEFIQQNLSAKQKEAVAKREAKGKAGILDLNLINFKVKENGDAYFVGEVEYQKKEFYEGPSQKNVFHFSNIVVMKVNKDGELDWMRKLPKNQAGIYGVGQMSFAYMEGKKADYVAFVDNPKNISLSAKDGVPAPHHDGKGGFLTTYKIDHETGELEKHTICDLNHLGKYKAYQFKVTRILNAGNGNFLMEVYIKGKQDMMVKFAIN